MSGPPNVVGCLLEVCVKLIKNVNSGLWFGLAPFLSIDARHIFARLILAGVGSMLGMLNMHRLPVAGFICKHGGSSNIIHWMFCTFKGKALDGSTESAALDSQRLLFYILNWRCFFAFLSLFTSHSTRVSEDVKGDVDNYWRFFLPGRFSLLLVLSSFKMSRLNSFGCQGQANKQIHPSLPGTFGKALLCFSR